ncbi:osmoprotectant ABC transporter substrate-binding protein [Desemzia sp. C1]|uniref:osmoprotectant ABC transporter substrate-binding protein n=1 Tax=Desemzia sp. C1 TaxID=2892016 RepID=UPI001E45230A|nr:osmoprotectant ABC transporter substrate-binding protein [Desemzia sp. C1]MCI3029719.1 osmoprotectant ABC transporter substrate-binding protein [Desemzia sp. C1]
MNKLKTKKSFLLSLVSAGVLAGCALPGLGSGSGEEGITVAGVTSTEGLIMSYVVEGMIEHYMDDMDVQVINNLGSSTVSHQALLNGDANIAGVKYTGTSLTGELGEDPITDPEKALEVVVEGFDEKFDQKWFPSYGFANSYAFMVTKETAEEYGLEKISDLEPYALEMNAGVDNSWIEREGDGYDAFLDTYGFDFNRVYPMQIGLVYDALQAGSMDIILGYSTDGRIASYDLVVLEDDLQLFPPYDASPLATNEILETYPELEGILLRMEGMISEEQMQEMNYEADNNLKEPQVVAEEFLKENNYFEDESSKTEGGE